MSVAHSSDRSGRKMTNYSLSDKKEVISVWQIFIFVKISQTKGDLEEIWDDYHRIDNSGVKRSREIVLGSRFLNSGFCCLCWDLYLSDCGLLTLGSIKETKSIKLHSVVNFHWFHQFIGLISRYNKIPLICHQDGILNRNWCVQTINFSLMHEN